MAVSVLHPAILGLLTMQGRGRTRRIWRRICQPRRLVLTAMACLLAVFWLGNAALTVLLREPAAPETLRAMLAFGFTLYAGWHLTKAAFFRPAAPLEWAPSEREVLTACPLREGDLIGYQLASVTVPTIIKAALFTLLLLPDLQCLPVGFLGIVVAMFLLEFTRMALTIATWGMHRTAYLVYRLIVVGALIGAALAAGATLVREASLAGRLEVGEGILQRFVDSLVQLADSPLGLATLPFQPCVELVVAESLSPRSLAWAAAALACVAATGWAVVGLFTRSNRKVLARERRTYALRATDKGLPRVDRPALPVRCMPRFPRLRGAGTIAWRQLLSARRLWGGLVSAMIAPAVLAVVPCFVIEDSQIAFLATTGALSFYTLLLLPAAVRFDFRRDLEELVTLKGLPMGPLATTFGQVLAPLILTSLFQCLVLALAIAIRSLPAYLFLVTMLVFIPMNAFIFALENVIFLLYPYRVQQEGLEVFLRTMLTFTGKGLLFAIGLAAMSVWGFAAAALTRGLENLVGIHANAYAIFAGGMMLGMVLMAVLALWALCRAYGRLDPIEDLPR